MEYTDVLYAKFAQDIKAMEDELAADVKINKFDILQDMFMLPEQSSKWGRLAAKAEDEYDKIDRRINSTIWPKALEAARTVIANRGERITKEATETFAMQDNTYIQACEMRGELKALARFFEKAEWSLVAKKDMIGKIAYRQGKELGNIAASND